MQPQKTLLLATTLLMFFAAAKAFSEVGYVGKIDLNGDGILDLVESGPESMFGNGGGPYSLSIMDAAGQRVRQYEIGGNHFFAVEKHNDTVRLWTYWRMSASEGGLTAYTFKGDSYTTQGMVIYPGDGGTEIGNSIYKAIFKKENLLEMERVEDYQPPPAPGDLKW